MVYHVSLAMALPLIILGVLLIGYCLVDIVRTQEPLLIRKWQWALAVVILVPIGAVCYVLVQKMHLVQTAGATPEELSTNVGTNLHLPEH